MTKLNSIMIMLAAVLFLSACGDNSGNGTEATDAQETSEATGKTYAIDAASSSVGWYGEKLAYGHNGTVGITEGSLSVENGNITGGSFTLDMSTIKDLDVEEAEDRGNLEGHLMGEDFFDVAKYPTAKFEVTGSTASTEEGATHMVQGNLTIKDVTKNIEIPVNVEMTEGGIRATSTFSINRADFNVQYGSKTFFDELVDDKVISDEIKYTIALVGSESAS